MSERLHAAAQAARINEATRAEQKIFRELLAAPCTPGWLSWRLGIDPGYVSRTLNLLELEGHLTLRQSSTDRRRREAELTSWGRRVARGLEEFEQHRVRKMLEELPRRQQKRLVAAMNVIVRILARDALTNLVERLRDG